jgi:nicotinate-nucleotide pyrophosphorylase
LATILIKNVPEHLLKELRRLKVEFECKTWAELLSVLASSNEAVLLSEQKSEQMRKSVNSFLTLRRQVSREWAGHPTVIEETRRSRSHETG